MNIMCDFPECECVGPERCEKFLQREKEFIDVILKKIGEEELQKAKDEEAPSQ